MIPGDAQSVAESKDRLLGGVLALSSLQCALGAMRPMP
jgi:hypothetical protein